MPEAWAPSTPEAQWSGRWEVEESPVGRWGERPVNSPVLTPRQIDEEMRWLSPFLRPGEGPSDVSSESGAGRCGEQLIGRFVGYPGIALRHGVVFRSVEVADGGRSVVHRPFNSADSPRVSPRSLQNNSSG